MEAELREHIEQAIHKLAPQCQKIFIMNCFDNKNVAKIAKELQLSPRTVKKYIEITLRKLWVEPADYLTITYLAYLLQT